MEEMLNRYLLAFDEINALTAVSYVQATGSLRERIDKITDDVLALLIKAYKHGAEDIAIMLAFEYDIDTNAMYDAIYQKIEGETFEDRILTHVSYHDEAGLQTLVASEYHRVYMQAMTDGARAFVKDGSLGVLKKWITMNDNKVRDTHHYLHGQEVPLEDEFYTFDNDHASSPGHFTRAENNVNCRCWLEWSIDPDV